jgi:hypothetical protein
MLSCMLCLLWHALKGLVKGDAGMHCEGLRGIGAIVARLVGNAIGFCALAVNGRLVRKARQNIYSLWLVLTCA